MQISYRYDKQNDILKSFYNFLSNNTHIENINAFMKYADHTIFDFPLLSFRDYKASANEFISIDRKANGLINNIKTKYQTEDIYIDDKLYKKIYITESLKGFKEDGLVLVEILLNQTRHLQAYKDAKIFILGFVLFGILLIMLVFIFFERNILIPIDMITRDINNDQKISDLKLLDRVDEIGAIVKSYNNLFNEKQKSIALKEDQQF